MDLLREYRAQAAWRIAAKAAACLLMLAFILAGVPSLSACTGSSATLTGDGKTVTIPSDVPQSGYYTVTCYDDFAGRWASGTGQEAVCSEWQEKGSVFTDGIATIDGLYLIACAETFGSTGDRVKFTLQNGTEISCVIADIKSSGDGNYTQWGHSNGGNVNVIEFEVARSYYEAYGNPGQGGWKDEWGGVAVNSVTNYGSGPNVTSSNGLSGCSSGAGGDGYLSLAMAIADDDSHGYSLGAQGPDSFDCQGLIKYCLAQNGWDVSPWGFKYGKGTAAAVDGLTQMGWTVKPYSDSEIEAGDILIYDAGAASSAGHVAIYAGDGQVVDAVNDLDGKPGDSSGSEIAKRRNSYGNWQFYARPPMGSSIGSAGSASGGLAGCSDLGGSTSRSQVVNLALSKLGAPYLHKDEGGPGMGPDSFVCDSFTAWVYRELGYELYESMDDTTFYAQYKWLNDRGKIVTSEDELKLGDIVFFGESWSNMRHAGIYYGRDEEGNHRMIHCAGTPLPGGGREGVTVGPLDSDFLGGGSPL